ncbi:MAG: hypothetical protein LBB81_02595, partial [Treponema sp.]|nr:hypothetical protein [Treponema sp.]
MKAKNENEKKDINSVLSRFRSGPALFSFALCVATIVVIIVCENIGFIKELRKIIGSVFLVFLFYAMYVILQGRAIMGRESNNSERYLLASITGIYIIGSVLIKNLASVAVNFPISLAIPTGLFIMLLAVFMGKRPAMIMAIALPLGAYYTGAFDNQSYFIALVSGAAASTVLHNEQNRMSLIKAGVVIAVANCFAVV